MRSARTLAVWLEALRASGWEGGEWSGPCPRCGGSDRFHVAAGSRAAIAAGARSGSPQRGVASS